VGESNLDGPIIIVSYIFPPSLEARGLQVAKLVKYTSRLGRPCEVVTKAISAPHASLDNSEGWMSNVPDLKVHRCGSMPKGPLGGTLVRLLAKPGFGWARNAAALVSERIAATTADGFACVMTCAMPMYSHLVGLSLKRRFPGLPWIAHFSDPWAETPYPIRYRAINSRIRRILEGRVLERADMVVFPSEELKDFMLEAYGASFRRKFFVLPHVYDPGLYGTRAVESDGLLRLAHVGGLNKVRGGDPLYHVLKKLVADGIPLDRLRIQLVGPAMQGDREVIDDMYPGLVERLGQVRYVESLRIMSAADCLLLIDADIGSSPFFPSKLADYFGSGRPVIGITPSGSCSSNLLREQGFPVFDYDQLGELAHYLGNIILGNTRLPRPNQEKLERYSAERVAGEFISLAARAQSLCSTAHAD
jgi:glycosyltransferase involved in cell wall biosynthesis